MLCGSAQTLSILGSMSSIDNSGRCNDCANNFSGTNTPAPAAQKMHKLKGPSHLPATELAIDLFLSHSAEHNGASSCSLGARQRSAARPEAAVFRLRGGLGFVLMLLRPSAGNSVIGTGAQINENVLKEAHHVSVGAERRHHALLRRVDVLAPIHDHTGVVGVAHGLQ